MFLKQIQESVVSNLCYITHAFQTIRSAWATLYKLNFELCISSSCLYHKVQIKLHTYPNYVCNLDCHTNEATTICNLALAAAQAYETIPSFSEVRVTRSFFSV